MAPLTLPTTLAPRTTTPPSVSSPEPKPVAEPATAASAPKPSSGDSFEKKPAGVNAFSSASSGPAAQMMQAKLQSAPIGEAGAGQAVAPKVAAPDPMDAPITTDAKGKYDLPKVLGPLSQKDGLDATKSDEIRCASNSTVGAMMARGKDDFHNRLDKMGDAAMAKGDALWKSGNKEEAAKWYSLSLQCISTKAKSQSGTLTQNDLSRQADAMHDAYGTLGSSPGGITGKATQVMLGDAGLAPGSAQLEPIGAPSADAAAQKAFDGLKPGETATANVAINDAHWPQDHAVTIGKKPDGTPFVYDSGNPGPGHYFEGDDAKKRLASKALNPPADSLVFGGQPSGIIVRPHSSAGPIKP